MTPRAYLRVFLPLCGALVHNRGDFVRASDGFTGSD